MSIPFGRENQGYLELVIIILLIFNMPAIGANNQNYFFQILKSRQFRNKVNYGVFGLIALEGTFQSILVLSNLIADFSTKKFSKI